MSFPLDIGLGTIIATVGLLLLWSISTAARRHRSMVAQIRGPPSPSWVVGHEQSFRNQDQVGDLEFQWVREYGAAFRLKGVFGEDALMVVGSTVHA
ncbi:hypothetical protein CYLTODRAFT_426399 [Cylindrobasidium torrendii FP15055 ss-10]|uniref:Cytochrome P450 n=1 Tax=Cylindrobasidium torrendii FP15055 ss-10 TaxID=1314674 RepID=A0A0D7AXX3_9AGAR|nr:hypothetical protein CYLTODRAFT_426399 [Cylindrobasidium torrendii FP15055 ss-10]